MFRLPPGHLDLGKVCGTTLCGTTSFSNGSPQMYFGERNFVDGVCTGVKWQSTEFVRRLMLRRKGVLLNNPLFPKEYVSKGCTATDAATGAPVKVIAVSNDGTRIPAPDSILVWGAGSRFESGHVAIVTEVGDGFIRIADQNRRYTAWADGAQHSDELAVAREGGGFVISDPTGQKPVCWLVVDAPNRPDAAAPVDVHASLRHTAADDFMMLKRVTFVPPQAGGPWLDESVPEEKQFIKTFGMDLSRTRLEEAEANYYQANTTLMDACHAAGVNLHRMFLQATDRVLKSDELLERFGIPRSLWARIRASWATQPFAISGRFDFALSEDGMTLKTFEYNADSASTLLECSIIQEKWANSVQLQEGSISSGSRMDGLLVHAWNEVVEAGVVARGSKVFFLVDNDDEEQYTALYVASGAQRAGLETQLCVMFDAFEWRGGHVVEKATGERVRTVWKTWAWETAISDLNDALAEEVRGEGIVPPDGAAVRLSDILLGESDISVFEPIWKLIPSNKAILPVLSEMFPGHPNLLRTEWTLSEELRASGYVKKPIVGRTGQNVTIVGEDGAELGQSAGKFSEREDVFQELFNLPKRDDYYAIMGGWILGSVYGGTGIREDKSIITNVDSPFSAIRIITE